MNKLSALALALALLVLQGLFGGPAAIAQPLGKTDKLLRLDVEQLSPRMVTPADQQVRLSATITNVGDRQISDIVARLQVGTPLTTEQELGGALSEAPPTDSASSEWVSVADTLAPDQSATFTVTVPAEQLALTSPGVYPMLVNVNGTPDYGGAARLAELNMLMPVIDPPSEAGPATVTMLWPITASRPKVAGTTADGQVILTDDDLADELRPGGRLDALVAAATSQRDSPLFSSLCFAIDPDLLDTVAAMAQGYRVNTPSGQAKGSGSEHAARWLESLKGLVSGHCVIQTPYADADLSALSKINSAAGLVRQALGGASIPSTLDVQQRTGVVWPGGKLDGAAMRAAADAGAKTLIADPTQLEPGSGSSGTTTVDGAGLQVLGYDPLVSSAFTGNARQGTSAVFPAAQPNVATQNGIAALAFRAGLGADEPSRPVLVAPPHGWDAPVGEFVTLLDALTTMRSAGMVTPTPLEQLLAQPASGSSTVGSGQDTLNGTSPFGPRVIQELTDVESTSADLRSAMSVDSTRQVDPASLIQPLHNAVLRATSTAWRSNGERRSAAATATSQVDALRGRVTVATPSQSVSLASGSSPLPVTLTNSLPVAVTVRIKMENIAGLRPDHIPDILLAANSSVPRLIPAEALRSGRFNIDVSLATPGGTRLGSTARLELQSNEFGLVTIVLTSTAAGALVLLSARRIYQRVKARKAG